MPNILHDFPIKAGFAQVFAAISNPAGLNAWWTKDCRGQPAVDSQYVLDFGPDYVWQATVTRCVPNQDFELLITDAVADWLNTRVGFQLDGDGETTQVEFWHRGWPDANQHYRTSCFCWAMYLRLMARYVTTGEIVPYEQRLEV